MFQDRELVKSGCRAVDLACGYNEANGQTQRNARSSTWTWMHFMRRWNAWTIPRLQRPAGHRRRPGPPRRGGDGQLRGAVYGVHSALPMSRARRLCPKARFIRPRMARYREKSAEVFSIFRDFTPLLEGLVARRGFPRCDRQPEAVRNPGKIGTQIKDRIQQETGLTASVGWRTTSSWPSWHRTPKARWPGMVDPEKVNAFLDPMPISVSGGSVSGPRQDSRRWVS